MTTRNKKYTTALDIAGWIDVIQQRNLVYNHDFRYFSNQCVKDRVIEFNHPDGWVYADPGSGGQIGLDGTNCRIVTSNDQTSLMSFSQALHEFPRWQGVLRGNKVSAKVCMSTNNGGVVTVSLTDGVTTSSERVTSAGSVEVDLQVTVADDAAELRISIESTSCSAVIELRTIYANVGAFALESLPCMVAGVIGERKQYIATQIAPAEELSLCDKPKELGGDFTRLDSVLNGRFGMGDSRSMLPDVRGLFSRAWNNSSESADPDASDRKMIGNDQVIGDYVGTRQADVFASHDHDIQYSPLAITIGSGPNATGINQAVMSSTQKTGGKESRPKNVAELFTIKWA